MLSTLWPSDLRTADIQQSTLLAVHNDQSLASLLPLHRGEVHGLDRPRATPRGGRQSERDIARNPLLAIHVDQGSARHLGDCRDRARGFSHLHGLHGPQIERERTVRAIRFLFLWRSGWSCAAVGCCTGTTTYLPAVALSVFPSRPISRRRDRARADHAIRRRKPRKCE